MQPSESSEKNQNESTENVPAPAIDSTPDSPANAVTQDKAEPHSVVEAAFEAAVDHKIELEVQPASTETAKIETSELENNVTDTTETPSTTQFPEDTITLTKGELHNLIRFASEATLEYVKFLPSKQNMSSSRDAEKMEDSGDREAAALFAILLGRSSDAPENVEEKLLQVMKEVFEGSEARREKELQDLPRPVQNAARAYPVDDVSLIMDLYNFEMEWSIEAEDLNDAWSQKWALYVDVIHLLFGEEHPGISGALAAHGVRIEQWRQIGFFPLENIARYNEAVCIKLASKREEDGEHALERVRERFLCLDNWRKLDEECFKEHILSWYE
ncbi:hypothetical protein BJ508DRAFT_148535 [Ascobolus immersus RN42]|uniref:Uncharacterized protein n=1 Tax=Ascobolus immersus RN42 TaxID=1160509 RepID=A0A3N4IPT9_ASCIM|nr:hypothetical protein BJ508DRAFT_148535 [Ascobolus immersus RN42]